MFPRRDYLIAAATVVIVSPLVLPLSQGQYCKWRDQFVGNAPATSGGGFGFAGDGCGQAVPPLVEFDSVGILGHLQ